jgi:DNA-binding transcriptional regulator YiaG
MVCERFSADFIRMAIEQYGSEAHLARALGVSRDEVHAWARGEARPPLALYQAIADLIEAQRKPRR